MEKTRKRSRNKKKKLSSLILLLFLTIIMLTTASYAWFTSNKTVTVSTLDVHVEAKSGLQISADGFTWKTVISNADISGASAGRYSSAVNQIPATLEPTSSAGNIDAATGYLEMFNGVIGEADDASGAYTLTATKAVDANGTIGNYIAFDLFLKTETTGAIYLTTDSNVIPKDNTEDRGLKNASRVGFVIMGNTDSDASLATIQALNNLGTNALRLWEPNYDVHTTHGVTAALEYGIVTSVGPDEALIPYDGVKAANATPIKLANANATDNATYFQAVTSNITTKASETQYKSIVTLTTGITKVRVYMWIEGQDVDCENNASGSDISFNVQFSTNSEP